MVSYLPLPSEAAWKRELERRRASPVKDWATAEQRPLRPVQSRQREYAVKIIVWVVGILAVIGLLVVVGCAKLIF